MGKRKQDFPQKDMATKKYRTANKAGMGILRAKKAAMAVKYGMRSERTPEVKFIDVHQNATSISNAGQVQLLNGSVEGSAYNNRIGQKIELTSISVEFVIGNATLTTGQGFPFGGTDVVKVALVYDKQTNGAALAYSDVFQSSASAQAPFGERNVNNLERFEVLKSGTYKIDTASNIAVHDSWYIPCHHQVRYNGSNAGTVGDIQTGSIYLVYADQGTVTTGAPLQIIGDYRVRFHDL